MDSTLNGNNCSMEHVCVCCTLLLFYKSLRRQFYEKRRKWRRYVILLIYTEIIFTKLCDVTVIINNIRRR